MVRLASQLIMCSPDEILRRSVLELEGNVISNIFSLDDSNVESAHTLFFDGIIAPSPVSLQQHIDVDPVQFARHHGCEYVNMATVSSPFDSLHSPRSIIIDFGSEDIDVVNAILRKKASLLGGYSSFSFLVASTFIPAILLSIPNFLKPANHIRPVLWEHTDLVNKTLLPETQLASLL